MDQITDNICNQGTETLIRELQAQIDHIERHMTELCGLKLYKSDSGFCQEDLYLLVGRNDNVCTISFREGSDSFTLYGDITVVLNYRLSERQDLERDFSSKNDDDYITAHNLLYDYPAEKAALLSTKGFKPKDIKSIVVGENTELQNTFPSQELRTPNILNIPYDDDSEKNGAYINWHYGFLKVLHTKNIGLSPSLEATYLAYKLILYPKSLTKQEKSVIFDNKGIIVNQEVAFHILSWKKDAGLLSSSENEKLQILLSNRLADRMAIVNHELCNMGLSLSKLKEEYPDKAVLLYTHIITFREENYNYSGRHPLYANFKSFLHIYLRHVEEMRVPNQFSERDKFQLAEENVLTVLKIIAERLNDEYQIFKDKHPQKRFYRRGDMAYYYKGDYYCIDVNLDGSINTFYRRLGKK